MAAKRTPYTVSARAAGQTCAVCGAKFREGDEAISVFDPDALSWHQHAECARPAADGGSAADRLMADIRAGKPPVNPPAQTPTRIQGGRKL
jgi:hypothetical protein